MLKPLVNNLDEVEEGLRSHYKEKDGKFYLQVQESDGFALENISGLKNTVQTLRRENRELEDKLSPYEGLDADAARKALKRVEKLKNIDPDKDVDKMVQERVDSISEQLKTQHDNELKPLKDRLAKRDAQLRELTVQNVVRTELQKLNPLEDALDAIEMLATRSVRVKEDATGNLTVEVVDEAGNPRVAVREGSVVNMGITDLMTEIRDKRPSLFKAENRSGVGMPPGAQTSHIRQQQQDSNDANSNPWKKESFNFTRQMLLSNTNPTLAARFKAEAGVK